MRPGYNNNQGKMTGVVHIALLLLTGLRVVLCYDPEASITGLYTGPYFDPLTPRNMTAHLGDEAKLPCTVRQLGDKSVSWVRVRDADILTVDRYTFVGDERFESHYSTATETWNLVIKYVQERDAGEYECQVSTEPKMSQLFSLRVVIPKVMIVPVGDRYVKAGSTVRVDCQITDVVQLPDYIFWYHEDKRVMDRHDPNLLVTVKRTDVEAITSTLTIHKVRQEQSGNYTCMPSNLHAASVTLHVLNEKHPAAMQGERTSGSPSESINLTLTLSLMVCALVWGMYLGPHGHNTKDTVDDGSSDPATGPSNSVLSSDISSSHTIVSSPLVSQSPLSGVPIDSLSDQEKRKIIENLMTLLKFDTFSNGEEYFLDKDQLTRSVNHICDLCTLQLLDQPQKLPNMKALLSYNLGKPKEVLVKKLEGIEDLSLSGIHKMKYSVNEAQVSWLSTVKMSTEPARVASSVLPNKSCRSTGPKVLVARQR